MSASWMMEAKFSRPPQRTCIACRQVKEKRDLIRLVRTENGTVGIDMLGKKPGRGAYICRRRTCWDLALRKNRLDYALRTKLHEHDRQALRNYICGLEGS